MGKTIVLKLLASILGSPDDISKWTNRAVRETEALAPQRYFNSLLVTFGYAFSTQSLCFVAQTVYYLIYIFTLDLINFTVSIWIIMLMIQVPEFRMSDSLWTSFFKPWAALTQAWTCCNLIGTRQSKKSVHDCYDFTQMHPNLWKLVLLC